MNSFIVNTNSLFANNKETGPSKIAFNEADPSPFYGYDKSFTLYGYKENIGDVPQREDFMDKAFDEEKSFDSCSFLGREDFQSSFQSDIDHELNDFTFFGTVSTKGKSNCCSGNNSPVLSGNKQPIVDSKPSSTPKEDSNRPKVNIEDDLQGYIQDVVDNGIRIPSLTAGRPKQEFDTSPERLQSFYEEYVSGLQSLIETNFTKKRSDTFRNTIFSYLKKLPIKLRELCCSVSEPKSKKMEVYLDAFLNPFVTCFLPYIPTDTVEHSKVELFLYFIVI